MKCRAETKENKSVYLAWIKRSYATCTLIDLNAYLCCACVTCGFAFIALNPLFGWDYLPLRAMQRRLRHLVHTRRRITGHCSKGKRGHTEQSCWGCMYIYSQICVFKVSLLRNHSDPTWFPLTSVRNARLGGNNWQQKEECWWITENKWMNNHLIEDAVEDHWNYCA